MAVDILVLGHHYRGSLHLDILVSSRDSTAYRWQRWVQNARGLHTGASSPLFKIETQQRTIRRTTLECRRDLATSPTPLACLPILWDRASLLAILITSVNYAVIVKMALQTSLSSQGVETYRLNYLSAGLIFLPSGVGGAPVVSDRSLLVVPYDTQIKHPQET